MNKEFSEDQEKISASPSQPLPCNELNYKGFSFLMAYGDKTGTNMHDYKRAKIYRGKKWFVYYSYRHPRTGDFERHRVYEDLNREKNLKLREREAGFLVDSVNLLLASGFNPYFDKREMVVHRTWDISGALTLFK